MENRLDFKKEVYDLWDVAIEKDPELLDGLQWCEKEAIRKGLSMDEFIYMILAKHKKDFDALNTEVRIVYPGQISTIPKFLNAVKEIDNEFDLTIPLLLDVELNVVNELGIKGQLAKPTSILIDKQGIVRYSYIGQNKADRPSIKTIIKKIKALN